MIPATRYQRVPECVPATKHQGVPPAAPTEPSLQPVVAHVLFEDNLPRVVEPTFSLAVSHCPWVAERAANMERLRPAIVRPGVTYREITDRAPNSVWSRIMWGWGAVQPVTHCVFLQDDIRLCGRHGFWPVIEAMVRAVPNRIISLISNHPFSERALAKGHAWFRMCETLGTGYIIPTPLMGAFLDWRDRQSLEYLYTTCEDFLITTWQYTTGRKSWCPVPTILQTMDAEISSTNPDISYPFQRSYFTADDVDKNLADIAYWTPASEPPDFGYCVSSDSRFPKGPFVNDEVLAAHYRLKGCV